MPGIKPIQTNSTGGIYLQKTPIPIHGTRNTDYVRQTYNWLTQTVGITSDATAKAASVQLLEIRLAMALGGKAFVTMTGDVASVQAAMVAGRQVIGDAGVLVNAVIISRPHPDVYKEVI